MKLRGIIFILLSALVVNAQKIISDNAKVKAPTADKVESTSTTIKITKDNTRPNVITRVYKLKYANPYVITRLLQKAAQTRRGTKQYGKVESVRYKDGSGAVIVSAEEYRFKSDCIAGIGLDELVKILDRPGPPPKEVEVYFYYPRYRDSLELEQMLKQLGTEYSEMISVDPQANFLVIKGSALKRQKVLQLLSKFDQRPRKIYVKYKVYRLAIYKDVNLEKEYKKWKNGLGNEYIFAEKSLFSATSTPHVSRLNFKWQWEPGFLNYLVETGKGDIILTGNKLAASGQAITVGNEHGREGPLWSDNGNDPNLKKKHLHDSVIQPAMLLKMKITPSVYADKTELLLKIAGTYVSGFRDDKPLSKKYSQTATVPIPKQEGRIFIGGPDVYTQFKHVSGIPWLRDTPLIGGLFGTDRMEEQKYRIVIFVSGEKVRDNVILDQDHLKIKKQLEAELKKSRDKWSGGRWDTDLGK